MSFPLILYVSVAILVLLYSILWLFQPSTKPPENNNKIESYEDEDNCAVSPLLRNARVFDMQVDRDAVIVITSGYTGCVYESATGLSRLGFQVILGVKSEERKS